MSRYGRDENPDREIPISSAENAKANGAYPIDQKSKDDIRNLQLELPLKPSGRGPEVPLRDHQISETQVAALADIGMFRAVTFKDLTNAQYGGDEKQALREINNLLRQKLVRRSISQPEKTIALTLTREGHRVLVARNKRNTTSEQVYYDGFVKPREAAHDTAIYRLYQKEAQEIMGSGGRVTRIALDFEIKKSLNRQLARLRSLPENERADRKAEIAKEHGLAVVRGKVQIPDLRLEYEDRDHNSGRVDLELATGHYRRGSLAAKSAAGFKIYAASGDAARLRPAMGDPEIMQEIFSL